MDTSLLTSDIRSRYRTLAALGIPYWGERSELTFPLSSVKPIFCAACLVLLPEKSAKIETEEGKILMGMLKVLELSKDELCMAWVQPGTTTERLMDTLLKWAPFTLLMLGEAFANVLIENPNFKKCARFVQFTYHPTELLANKALKRKSYTDLLHLKEHISLMRVR